MASDAALEIRAATPADLEALASRAHPKNFKLSNREAARHEAEAWLGQTDVRVLIATLDGEPIGYLLLYIDQIALSERARGAGYGKRLLAAGVALARELGIDIVELDVYHFNADARAFFISQGFEPLRERLTQVLP